MNSLLLILLAALSLALTTTADFSGDGEPSPIDEVVLIPEAEAEEFPGDWDLMKEKTAPRKPSDVPEPTAAILIGILGFTIMLRKRG